VWLQATGWVRPEADPWSSASFAFAAPSRVRPYPAEAPRRQDSDQLALGARWMAGQYPRHPGRGRDRPTL